jgi:hypothetical protein
MTSTRNRDGFRPSHGEEEPSDPLLDGRNIEIDQQTKSAAGELQAGEQLRFVYRENAFNGLDLDRDEIGHDHIHPESALQPQIALDDRSHDLGSNLRAARREFIGEALLID